VQPDCNPDRWPRRSPALSGGQGRLQLPQVKDADGPSRSLADNGVVLLITRRSQVQILPPPPRGPGRSPDRPGLLVTNVSWGLGALGALTIPADNASSERDDPRFVPSFVYFGVREPEAVWMRMIGVPRFAAPAAAELWRASRRDITPSSYDELREFVGDLTGPDWSATLASSVTGDDMVGIWSDLLAGV
jgi:hypothetical protein